jgi:hypothetical protein
MKSLVALINSLAADGFDVILKVGENSCYRRRDIRHLQPIIGAFIVRGFAKVHRNRTVDDYVIFRRIRVGDAYYIAFPVELMQMLVAAINVVSSSFRFRQAGDLGPPGQGRALEARRRRR